MIAAAHRPPSVTQERGDTFLTGMESGDEDNDDGDLFILPQTSHGASNAAEADVLPPLPPIGDPRRRSRHFPAPECFISRLKFLFLPPISPFISASHQPPLTPTSSVLQRNKFDVHAFEPPPPPPPPPVPPKCSLMTGILHHEKLRLPAEWLSSHSLIPIADDASARPFNDNVCLFFYPVPLGSCLSHQLPSLHKI
jgi:hypothetical protein